MAATRIALLWVLAGTLAGAAGAVGSGAQFQAQAIPSRASLRGLSIDWRGTPLVLTATFAPPSDPLDAQPACSLRRSHPWEPQP
ncbi:MAG: hypothetical protein ACRD1E_08000, partial [Terriglobales bacterium]